MCNSMRNGACNDMCSGVRQHAQGHAPPFSTASTTTPTNVRGDGHGESGGEDAIADPALLCVRQHEARLFAQEKAFDAILASIHERGHPHSPQGTRSAICDASRG